MKKMVLAAAVFLLAAMLCAGLKLFVIGEPVDGDQLMCAVTMMEEGLRIRAETPESAMALRGWEHWQDGSDLHIRGWKVPVSIFFRSGSYETVVDVSDVEQVYVGGWLVWQK